MTLSLRSREIGAGRYFVAELLGRGGMASAYRAPDTKLRLNVALKFLPAHFPAHPAFVERFRREGHTLAKMTHANILRLYEMGEDESNQLYYLVLEYLTGGSLKERLARGLAPTQDAIALLRPVAAALDFAHGLETPVVH